MIRTQIQLTEEQYAELKERAKVLDVSMAKVIREAVQLYLSKSAGDSIQDRRKAAMSIAGRFESGLADLAEGHDRYADEAYAE